MNLEGIRGQKNYAEYSKQPVSPHPKSEKYLKF